MLSADGTTRLDGIKRKLSGVSDTMLVKSLKELNGDGLVRRHEYIEVPVRVEYEVTDAARALIPILTELAKVGKQPQKRPCDWLISFRRGPLSPFLILRWYCITTVASHFGELYVAVLLFFVFFCII